MSLASRIDDVVTAIGQDIKTLFSQIANLTGSNTVTLTIMPAAFDEATINVVNANVISTQIIRSQLLPNNDFDLDDLNDYEIRAQAKDGSIDFYISADSPIVGNFKVAYQII